MEFTFAMFPTYLQCTGTSKYPATLFIIEARQNNIKKTSGN